MDVNPYQAPRELVSPQMRTSLPVARLASLRAFGVYGGMFCCAAFFGLLLLFAVLHESPPPRPGMEYVLIGTVISIFVGCILSLLAIVVGNALQR
jgi:hypothetical protein